MRNDPRSWDDAQLLAAVAARDGQAFSVLYNRYLSALLAYLVRETRDPETAADLAAETWAAVLLSASRYTPERSTALPWVIGIARNKLLMSLRRGRVETNARHRLELEPIALDDADLDRVEALAGAGRGRLEQLVAELPGDEGYVVRSHVVDERSYRELATELSCSELVIRKRVSRGLARLREQVGDEREAL